MNYCPTVVAINFNTTLTSTPLDSANCPFFKLHKTTRDLSPLRRRFLSPIDICSGAGCSFLLRSVGN